MCLNDGLADNGVVKELQSVTTLDQYNCIDLSACREEEKDDANDELVPKEWTGDGIWTKMHEFKMLRLREKCNRILLQGGRLQHKHNQFVSIFEIKHVDSIILS